MDNGTIHIPEELMNRLLHVASRLAGGGAEEAEDIVQETLISLWALDRQGYEIRNMEALAVRIVRNIGVSHHRRRKLATEPIAGDNYDGGTPADATTANDDIEATMRKLYSSLSDSQRELLRLRNEFGMSIDEIAGLTGRPKTSIKSSISAARHQMLEALKKDI